MKKKPKPVTLPPRRKRNVTAAKAIDQKAGPFKRKPKEYEVRPWVLAWRDEDEIGTGGW